MKHCHVEPQTCHKIEDFPRNVLFTSLHYTIDPQPHAPPHALPGNPLSTAMASSLCFAGTLPIKASSMEKQPTVQTPGLGPYCVPRKSQLPVLKFAARPASSLPTVVAAAAASTVGVEPHLEAATTAKVLPFRVGHGFDLHRLEPGYPLIIGGINIPHERGCEAHSDGDVLLHCVVDAILGALGLPDIGQIFPDTDPKWKGAASCVFVEEAVRLMHEAGYELGNLDATLILQRPKLSPHKEAIRENLCKLLGADTSAVNLKAKTHEKVDSLGENRSIAAHTVVLLFRK